MDAAGVCPALERCHAGLQIRFAKPDHPAPAGSRGQARGASAVCSRPCQRRRRPQGPLSATAGHVAGCTLAGARSDRGSQTRSPSTAGKFADEMDFRFLLDPRRKLLSLGFEVETGKHRICLLRFAGFRGPHRGIRRHRQGRYPAGCLVSAGQVAHSRARTSRSCSPGPEPCSST